MGKFHRHRKISRIAAIFGKRFSVERKLIGMDLMLDLHLPWAHDAEMHLVLPILDEPAGGRRQARIIEKGP